METLKKYWKKFVLGLAALVAGVGLAILVFKKHVTGELGDYFEAEADARREAKKKLEAEQEKLKLQQQKELQQIEKEQKQKLLEAERLAEAEEKRLKRLEGENEDAFNAEVEKQLGVKQKKRGRPKKNE